VRPKIEGRLEDRIKSIYKDAGYGTASELIRDAVRSHLTELEAELHDSSKLGEHFTYRIITSPNTPPEIRIFPSGDTKICVEERPDGDSPAVIIDTGTSYVGSDHVTNALDDIEGIERCLIPMSGDSIRIYLLQVSDNRVEFIINSALSRLEDLVENYDASVKDGDLDRIESYQNAIEGVTQQS
jgi:Arc/MetJ-type ribon-helix-helix transcriptional regulator